MKIPGDVGPAKSDGDASSLGNRDLLSEGKNFEGSVTATAKEQADGSQGREDEFGHELTLVS